MDNYTNLIIRNLGLKDCVDATYDGQYVVFTNQETKRGIRLKFMYNYPSGGKLTKILVRYYGSSNVYARRNQVCKILYKDYDSIDIDDIVTNLRNRKELNNYID